MLDYRILLDQDPVELLVKIFIFVSTTIILCQTIRNHFTPRRTGERARRRKSRPRDDRRNTETAEARPIEPDL
jgi:hypothetical protein